MKGVRYVSFAENSGYGLSGRAYMQALLRAEVPLRWLPLIQTFRGYVPWHQVDGSRDRLGEVFGEELVGAIDRDIDYDTNILHCVPEYWPLYIRAGKRNIGYTVWETDALPAHWVELLNQTDRLLVPCRFNIVVFERSGINRPIDTLPHIDPPRSPLTPGQIDAFAERYGVPKEHYVFYATDVWNPRKAPWKTLHAYLRAFTGDDPVSFIFKTSESGPRSSVDVENMPTDILVAEIVGHYSNAAHMVVIKDELPGEEIEALHELGDCYLSLTHSEGWGLGAFQAASRGNAVIITGWGGHLDYLSADWPYLVDYEMTPVMHAQGRGSYSPSQNWASPSLEHAVNLMQSVFRNPERAREEGRALAARVSSDYSESVIGQKLLTVLQS